MTAPSALDPTTELRTAQLIVGAFAFGVTLFAAVAAFVGPVGQPLPQAAFGLDVLALTALALTAGALPAAFLLPGRIVEAARASAPEQRRRAFRASRILAGAMIEGPALFWCVALLLSGIEWYLAPIAFLIGLLVFQLPSRGSYEESTGESLPRI